MQVVLRKIIVKKQRLIERGIGYVNRKKFGGTSVANRERILTCGKRCKKEYEKGNDVVVVLSAMGDVTDRLIDKAKEINETPSEREMDMLFTIGEQMSVALMAMALEGLGVPAVSLNAFQAKIHTTSVHGDAKITHIETERIREELAQKKNCYRDRLPGHR